MTAPHTSLLRQIGRWLAVGLLALSLPALAACNPTGGGAQQATSTYDRVIETGVIRAAFTTYPPAAMRDPTTGEMSGIFVDALERAASNLGLRVEWTEEVGWGAQIEGLEAGRYDIIGSPVWANPTRGKLATMSRPLYYSGIGVYVRGNDNRFRASASGDWSALNVASVRIATIDGETGDLIARNQFPTAQRVSLPQTADISQLFLQVSNNHADVLFAEPYFAREYARNNPRALTNLAAQRPISVLGNCYMFRRNEFQMKHMIDAAMEELLNNGYIDQLLQEYEGGDTFYRVALPYRSAE